MGKSAIYSIQILATDSENDVQLKPEDYHQSEKPFQDVRRDERQQLLEYGLERRADGLIYWDSGSKDHPRNWSMWRKVFDTTIIILLEFYTYVLPVGFSSHELPNTECRTIISTTGVSQCYLAILLVEEACHSYLQSGEKFLCWANMSASAE